MEFNHNKIFINNGSYMITFRLADSLPQSKFQKLKAEYHNRVDKIVEENQEIKKKLMDDLAQEIFGKFEHQLHEKPYGSCILANEKIASILYTKIVGYHNQLYGLKCLSIMPNHVHIVLSSLGNTPENETDKVDEWVNLIKGGSSRLMNLELGTSGAIWSKGYWDRYIRNEQHYHNSFYYTINNPSSAGLDNKFNSYPYMWRIDKDRLVTRV